MLALALVALTTLPVDIAPPETPAPVAEASESRRLVLPVPPSSEGTAPLPSPAPEASYTMGGVDLVVGAVTFLAGLAGVALPLLSPTYVAGPAIPGVGANTLFVPGTFAALAGVIVISAAIFVLTGRSPFPAWRGTAPGIFLAAASVGAFVATQWVSESLLTDEDIRRAGIWPCTPAVVTAVAGLMCSLTGWLAAGPVIALGAAIGAVAADTPESWPPFFDELKALAADEPAHIAF